MGGLKKALLIFAALLSCVAFAEYKIVKSENGRFYLDEDSVVALASYIAKLEALNENYKLQIANLEEQVRVLKEALAQKEREVEVLKVELEKTKKALEEAKLWRNAMTVVAAVTIGTLVILFVK